MIRKGMKVMIKSADGGDKTHGLKVGMKPQVVKVRKWVVLISHPKIKGHSDQQRGGSLSKPGHRWYVRENQLERVK